MVLLTTLQSQWRARIVFLGAGIVLATWWAFFGPSFFTEDMKHHEIDIESIRLPSLDFLNATAGDRRKQHAAHYASKETREFCAAHGYSTFAPRRASYERKVYDLFIVNNELDHLEIRLDTLYSYVDYFIIVESPKTFQGGTKDLVIKQNWDRFRRFHDKMIYSELKFPAGFNPQRTWDYEDLQRDAMFEQVMLELKDQRRPADGDVIIVADVDEVPRPEALIVLRSCNYPRRLTMSSKFYYYSYQNLHVGAEWPHPQATFFQGLRTLKPTNLRNGDGGFPPLRDMEKGLLSNSGWHCSSCFGTMAEFLNKMASFSHKWMNRKQYRDKNKIAAAVREGKDVWERDFDKFIRIQDNKDVPPLILNDQKRFSYMTDRDGPSAGFLDYDGK